MLLRDRVYQSIRQAILSCEFGPGQELREQTLAERYKVSRSPIRDSLLRLEQESLIVVLPRQGYRVAPISLADVDHVAALRLVIEPACAAGAALANDAAVRDLDQFRVFPDQGRLQSAFTDYNAAFHNAVAVSCGNQRMAAVARELVDQFARFVMTSLVLIDDATVNQLVTEHCLLIDAIQAHDRDTASRLAHDHAKTGHDVILTALRRIAIEQNGITITE